MTRLNSDFSQPAIWKQLLLNAKQRVGVDLQEVERVIELARRTPGLAQYDDALRQVSVFFQVANQVYRQHAPNELTNLVGFWERYRAAVIQRFTAITPVELRAADNVVRDIFHRFLNGIPNENIAYSKDATPLVYGGKGGPSSYFTHPPGLNRPFAIINLPHTAFDSVWQWLALPHETGHDTYACVEGLSDEVESALADAMRTAVNAGKLTISDVDVDLNPLGVNHRIQYSGVDFLATVWRSWANEAQADVVGILACGGAAPLALQQIIGFSAEDQWELRRTHTGIEDSPEVHPTPYVRNALSISALRILGHGGLADEIEARFQALRATETHIRWRLRLFGIDVAAVDVDQMVHSAAIAADVLLSTKFLSLGNKTYRDIGEFTPDDQQIVDDIAGPLVAGDPTFAQAEGVTPRHSLAATMFAFEKDHQQAAAISWTFKHFSH